MAASRLLSSAVVGFACVLIAGCGGSGSGGSGSSAPSQNPSPTLTSIAPASAVVGSPQTTITLTGSSFLSSSVVQWNGAALTTTDSTATSLSATVPASDLATAGTAQVVVQNPAPGGGASTAVTFTIANPAPTLTSISPASAPAGSGSLTLTLTGTLFLSSSVVQWNGAALPTTYASATSLTATVPGSDLATAGAAKVTVVNAAPGGGASNAETFNVTPIPKVTTISVDANHFAWDPADNLFYLTLPAGAANGNSVVSADPLSGKLGTPANVGSEPNVLSVSATGKYLYVGLDGDVERMTLPGLEADATIPLGVDYYKSPFFPQDLQASPAADQTFAVSRASDHYLIGGVFIYDDTTARLHSLCANSELPVLSGCVDPGSGPYLSMQWNQDASMLYLSNGYEEGANLYNALVDSTGVTSLTIYAGLLPGFLDSHIEYDPTTKLLYGTEGMVVDPVTGKIAGNFQFPLIDPIAMVPDGASGIAYFLFQDTPTGSSTGITLVSEDMHTYALLNTYHVPNVTGIDVRQLVRWGTYGLAFLTNDVHYGGGTPDPATDDALHIIYDPAFVGNKTAAKPATAGSTPSAR